MSGLPDKDSVCSRETAGPVMAHCRKSGSVGRAFSIRRSAAMFQRPNDPDRPRDSNRNQNACRHYLNGAVKLSNRHCAHAHEQVNCQRENRSIHNRDDTERWALTVHPLILPQGAEGWTDIRQKQPQRPRLTVREEAGLGNCLVWGISCHAGGIPPAQATTKMARKRLCVTR
jgi:hypothetical protein